MAVKKVKRRGKLVWRARVMLGGKTAVRYCSRKDDAVEAEAELRERLENEAQAAATGLPHWEGKVPTLAEFRDAYIRDAEARNSKAEIKHKKQHLRDHLLPAFGKLRLDQITTQLVDGFVATKLKRLSPSTVNKLLATLRRALNIAHDWGVIGKTPKFRPAKLPQAEFDFLDFDEAERFLDGAEEKWRTFLLTAIRTGLRLGELRGLQWGDVDLKNKRLRVARAFTQTGWGVPKSGKGRTVDLAHDIVAILEAHRPGRAARTALVFPGPSGAPLDEKAVYKACVAASEAAGLGRVVGPHKLRHTYASHHAMRGTPMPVLQAWLGHSSIAVTMKYAHLAPSTRASFADAIASGSGPRLVVDNIPREVRGGPTGGPKKRAVRQNGS